MATKVSDKYAYFIRGRQIIVFEYGRDEVHLENTPDYSPPKTTITDGLLLEYTAIDSLDEILNENDDIPLHDTLALAVVDYIKAQLVEDLKDYSKKEYYMAKFKDRISKYTNARTGGLRRVLGNENMV